MNQKISLISKTITCLYKNACLRIVKNRLKIIFYFAFHWLNVQNTVFFRHLFTAKYALTFWYTCVRHFDTIFFQNYRRGITLIINRWKPAKHYKSYLNKKISHNYNRVSSVVEKRFYYIKFLFLRSNVSFSTI